MIEEFGNNSEFDGCFFIDFLRDEENDREGMSIKDEETLKEIWNDLHIVFIEDHEGKQDTNEQKEKPAIRPDDNNGSTKKYNITVTEEQINYIENLLRKQCDDLRVKEQVDIKDKATYGIIMVGKQNNNQPLLMYLCDAYNRYRIMRRKRFIRRYGKDTIEFKAKWSDPDSKKFINEKCKGFETWIGKDYNTSQKTEFKDRCQSSINVFYRRLLGRPPMGTLMLQSVINDSILQICWYIFQSYSFIHQYICQPGSQQTAPLPSALPCHIDIVIIPKKFKILDSSLGDDTSGDDSEHEPNEYEEKDYISLGVIDERLKEQKNVIKKVITSGTADRTMRQALEKLFSNKRHQRGIIIIDRRDNDNNGNGKDKKQQDMLYCYQPDESRNCHLMEKNPEIFLSESLIQNSRTCLLPKYNDDEESKQDIGVNRNVGDTMTLSFHCFSATEVRVYLSYCGWGTRFFIEDIKYYLPSLVIIVHSCVL